MKKLFLFTIAIFSFSSLFSQIKMNSTGEVGIGGYPASNSYDLYTNIVRFSRLGVATAATSSYPVSFNCNVEFKNNTYSGLKIGQGYYDKTFYPTSNNTGEIGTSSYKFGDIWGYIIHYQTFAQFSDKRIKENIKCINNSIDIIMGLEGVRFDYKKDFYQTDSLTKNNEKIKAKVEKIRNNNLGFIAQDVQKVLPEIVLYDDSTDIYSVNTTALIPILVEAIKEQQAQIEELKASKEVSFKNTEAINKNVITDELAASLGACQPNPFNEEANISFHIPSTVSQANLYIYDLQGKQIKNILISERFDSYVTIHANEFVPGMYRYVLIADNIIIGNETMILTD
ncbi:MAG: tail fiber domain-containing protein [Bacteroidales bacterium]|nr:tail fiber domain-containing protein [Bacteroidales bacterium]